jgi:hypothetical protein
MSGLAPEAKDAFEKVFETSSWNEFLT